MTHMITPPSEQAVLGPPALEIRYLGNAATEFDPKSGKSRVGKYEVIHHGRIIGVIDLGPTTLVESSKFLARLREIGLIR